MRLATEETAAGVSVRRTLATNATLAGVLMCLSARPLLHKRLLCWSTSNYTSSYNTWSSPGCTCARGSCGVQTCRLRRSLSPTREGAGAARGALPLPPPPPRREVDRSAWGSPPGLALPRRPGSALGDERPAGSKPPPPPGLRAAGATPPGSGSRGVPSGAVLANADFLGDLRRLAQVFPLGVLRHWIPVIRIC